MPTRTDPSDAHRLQLSALMDGELPAGETGSACVLFQQDAETRQTWHAWHLVGDVLRSDELATDPARDEAFLQALRLRLADEPVPLAPVWAAAAARDAAATSAALPLLANGFVAAAPQGGRRGRSRLMAPMAVAAGFVAVVGVLLATRMMGPDGAAPVLASAPATPAVKAGPATASAVLVRDAQLDRYLSAHRSLASGSLPVGSAEHRVHIVFEGQ